MFVCFRDFAFDPASRTLLQGGRPVHLTPRGVKLLEVLLANRQRAVPKDELVRQVWPETFVSEGSLANVVMEVRRALNDEQRSEVVRTFHGFGYAFIAETWETTDFDAAVPGMFRVSIADREIGLSEGENWIGRAVECRVRVYSSSASRRHACILVSGQGATLTDGGSRNGTYLRGAPVKRPTPLGNRDRIRVGTVQLTFRIVRPDDSTDAE